MHLDMTRLPVPGTSTDVLVTADTYMSLLKSDLQILEHDFQLSEPHCLVFYIKTMVEYMHI
jgi:hypothetical protein